MLFENRIISMHLGSPGPIIINGGGSDGGRIGGNDGGGRNGGLR
jgi:hypothetical protein